MKGMTKFSIQQFCTIQNLRMQNGQWLIDVIDHSNKKAKMKTIAIGKRLSWQKLSKRVPKAVFNKRIRDYLVEGFRGITYAKLKVEVIDNKGYWIPFEDKDGNLLISIDTGNGIPDDLREAIKRHNRKVGII